MKKWRLLRPNLVTNRMENARNRFLRPNLVGEDTYHAKNVSLGILTNLTLFWTKGGGYRRIRDENRGAAGQIAQNGPENNCAKWHLSNTNSQFFAANLIVPPGLSVFTLIISNLTWYTAISKHNFRKFSAEKHLIASYCKTLHGNLHLDLP